MVTPKWNPDTITDDSLKFTADGTCYTGWIFENEITDQIKDIQRSSVVSDSYLVSYAIDGYFAGKTGGLDLSTGNELYPRVEFEFNKKVNIRKILIISSSSIYFKSVEAFVGDQSQILTGDYSSFTSLGIQGASSVSGLYFKAEFESAKPVSGTILAFKGTLLSAKYIRISEIRVFS